MGLAFLVCSFIITFALGNISLGLGISSLVTIGYFFGIVRGNFPDGFSHFIFDFATIGLYLARFLKASNPDEQQLSRKALTWACLLMGWPAVLALMPINHYLIQLVALRHIAIFLPLMILGARMKREDHNLLATVMSVLNIIVFLFTLGEYMWGVEAFYPLNPITELIYKSYDIFTETGRYSRLPGTFANAHSNGFTMLWSMPWLFNMALDPQAKGARRLLGIASIFAGLLVIFMAGPRQPIVVMILAFACFLLMPGLSGKLRFRLLALMIVMIIPIAFFVSSDERLQRFLTLGETEQVEGRLNQSLNFSFTEAVENYPLGAGLGSVVGASVPFFLEQYAPKELLGAENEYARIAMEQGIVGLLLWISVIITLVLRRPSQADKNWRLGFVFMRVLVGLAWATAFIGTGMLQSIPSSALMLLQMGVLLRMSPQINMENYSVSNSQ